jgi:dihydrofolate synthase / folylpolyglutamate synthase
MKKFSYEDALDYLYGLQKFRIRFGLSKTLKLLNSFGNPHHGRNYIHVAGTNGKGSVSAMLESILMESGLKVGLYSSPHLVRFTERVRINQEEISPEEVVSITGELARAIDPGSPPTVFEVITAMALIHFARKNVDIAVMEAGMGGRLDATNVIRPRISVITNISFDHQFLLGKHLKEIAGEKAGIIKKGVDLVTAATQPSVLGLFKSVCRKKGAPFWRVGREMRYRGNESGFNYYGLDRSFRGLRLGLTGRFQHRNAALALGVIELLERNGLRISSGNIINGMLKCKWPGRMHVFSREPLIVLDGAHNPAAIRKLCEAVRGAFRYRRLILVLGVMKDKDIRGIIRGIVPISDYALFTRPDYSRAALPEDLMREAQALGRLGECVPFLPDALDRAKRMAGREDLILICGSLFTVGEAMTCLDPEAYQPDKIRL